MENISISVGRDYSLGYSSRYEFCAFNGDRVVHREGNYKTAAAARRAAIKWAAA